MSLFEAPGWESGTTPIIASTSSGKKSHKRKRGPANTDDDTGGEATNISSSTGVSPNLQKMMRKMRLGRDGRNAAMERLKPSLSTQESLKTQKNRAIPHIVTNMDPPQTPSSMYSDSFSPQTPGVNGRPEAKKPRFRREESDVLPPSSAGDETEPAHVLAEIRKKKKSKRTRRTVSSEPTAPRVSPEACLSRGSDEKTPPASIPPAARGVSGDEGALHSGAELTELQRKMKQKLSGSRFRMINELLYKSDSSVAHDMMRRDPGTFEEYHAGFRNQVQFWQKNPVVHFTETISLSYPSSSTVIADLGCGDAALAKSLASNGFKVLSYDLVSDNEWVIEADICHKLPLPGKEDVDNAQIIDVCVCALSLMSTNWIRCIREARRVLKLNGSLEIAEVTSRLSDVPAFTSLICSLGFDFVWKSDASTHFMLFTFRKAARNRALTRRDWSVIESKAKDLLSPCEYKRR